MFKIFASNTLRKRIDEIHDKGTELSSKYVNSKEVLESSIKETRDAIDKAHKHIDRTYMEVGKVVERKRQAESICKDIYDQLGEDTE